MKRVSKKPGTRMSGGAMSKMNIKPGKWAGPTMDRNRGKKSNNLPSAAAEFGSMLFVIEFGLARELRRAAGEGHRVIKRKLKSNDGPLAHAARLTASRDNLTTKLPARMRYKVKQSNKRLKKRQVAVGPHHEHAKKARVVAAWRKRQAADKVDRLDVMAENANRAIAKAKERPYTVIK